MTTRWEHRLEILHLSGKDDVSPRVEAVDALDALGREGWEVVGMSPSHASSHGFRVETTEFVVLLKRQLKAGGRRERES